MKTAITLSTLVLLAILAESESQKFGQLCANNQNNRIRGSDKFGQGHYGAPRTGGRKHSGVDVMCSDGATVYAPFDVTIQGKSFPYSDPSKKAINDGLKLSGAGLCFNLWYVKPVKYSGVVKKGQRLGTMMPMQKVYPGITSHLHLQLCNKANPTSYLR
ncbi:leukocyte cell-derived chemotaxin-2-like [Esox lucius]|uniref:Peptidase M23 domain-containing protein n=1 Tax=Esox lucius TaxID=8010 RepID=A0A3P9AHY2_ESOLU|nr:leukocyte cell-derived chemotaxin-2-like [Esox lucius]